MVDVVRCLQTGCKGAFTFENRPTLPTRPKPNQASFFNAHRPLKVTKKMY